MNSVRVYFRHWKGSAQTTADNSDVMVIADYQVNGYLIDESLARLVTVGPFLLLEVSNEGEWTERTQEKLDEFRSHFGPDSYEESTDDDHMLLYVSRLEFVELAISDVLRA